MASAAHYTKCRALVPFIFSGGMSRVGEIIDMPSGAKAVDEKLDQLVLCKVLERVVETPVSATVKRRRS